MSNPMNPSILVLSLSTLLSLGWSATADTFTINFDTDAVGNPITAPTLYSDTSPLTTLYAPLGVVFSGPAANQGGAILNDSSFGTPAHSGHNIFAFNPATYATFPETLTFSTLVSDVQIHASGSFDVDTISMQAFDNLGTLVDTAAVSTRPFQLLQVSYQPGIRSVVLNQTAGGGGTEFDDLTFVTVPEPSPLIPVVITLLLVRGFGFCRCAIRAEQPRFSELGDDAPVDNRGSVAPSR